MVAAFSEELSSWGGPFCISQQQDRLPQDATGPSVPVPPPTRPTIECPAISVATRLATLQPEYPRVPEGSGFDLYSFRECETGLAMSEIQTQACKY